MKAVCGVGMGTVSERVVYTVVSYLSLAVSVNLLLYAITLRLCGLMIAG